MTTAQIDKDLAALTGLIGNVSVDELFTQLLETAPTKPAKGGRSTQATRKAATRKAIETMDLDRLIELRDKMSKIIDQLADNELDDDKDQTVLTEERAKALMQEFIDERDIDELLKVRREMIREAVFAHFDAVAELRGEKDPANTNGTLEVPELGMKFCREGAGYGTPVVDEERLAAKLGDRLAEAYEEVYIPAHTERRLSVERLLNLAQQDPSVLEALRDSLVPGKRKTPRFVVREISQ